MGLKCESVVSDMKGRCMNRHAWSIRTIGRMTDSPWTFTLDGKGHDLVVAKKLDL